MAQEIILKRNTDTVTSLSSLPQGEAAAYAKLDALTHKVGQPVCVLYVPEHTKGQGTGNVIAALYAIGTGDGVGMYQAFASLEDMMAVDAKFSDMFEKVPYDETDLSLGYYVKVKYDFVSSGTISMYGLPDGSGDTGSGTGGNLTIKFDENLNLADEYISVNGILTLPAYPSKVSELANDADYATKEYVEDAIQDAKDTRVDTIIGTTIPALKSDITAAQTTATDAQTKVNTLIGSDSGKSVRDISKLAVADLLSGADADFDTLIEIANYLETHETDAVAMSNAIEALKKITKTFYNGGTVTEDSIKTYIDNAVSALENGKVATAIANIATLTARKITAGNGLSGGGDLSADRTLSVKANGDSIDVSSSGVKVNTVDNLTSTSTSQPLSANQGKTLQSNITTLGAKTVTAGNGLTGGGAISGSPTINVVAGDSSIVVEADSISVGTIDGGTF